MGVAKVVNPDAVNACEVCELLHCTRKPCLCGRKPVVAQYELAVRDDNALHLAPCGEFGKRVLIQIDGADCRTRLRFRELVALDLSMGCTYHVIAMGIGRSAMSASARSESSEPNFFITSTCA